MSKNEGRSHECAFLLEPEVSLVSYYLVGRHITPAVLNTSTGMSKKSRLCGSVLRIACCVPYRKPEWHSLQSQSVQYLQARACVASPRNNINASGLQQEFSPSGSRIAINHGHAGASEC